MNDATTHSLLSMLGVASAVTEWDMVLANERTVRGTR